MNFDGGVSGITLNCYVDCFILKGPAHEKSYQFRNLVVAFANGGNALFSLYDNSTVDTVSFNNITIQAIPALSTLSGALYNQYGTGAVQSITVDGLRVLQSNNWISINDDNYVPPDPTVKYVSALDIRNADISCANAYCGTLRRVATVSMNNVQVEVVWCVAR